MSNADKIQAWRNANPDTRITEQILFEVLGVGSLRGANLTRANLTDANLWGAELINADLRGAYLWGATLTNANLWGANLTDANLWGADLRRANLTGSSGGVAQVENVYPYPATIQPTPNGWYARVGCWYGTLDELRDIATSDDWPEARGYDRERRRPLLQAMLGVFDAHVTNRPDVIDRLHEYWGEHNA